MRLLTGTSGFAYKEWAPAFYPEGIRGKAMLAWYARHFDTVEINSTFYRFPTEAGLAAWAAQVPDRFRFAIKVPQRITHQKRLRDVDQEMAHLVDVVTTLGPRLGALSFLLPARLPPDIGLLRDLTIRLPPGLRAAFEFRDSRWLAEPVYQLLEEQGYALCFNDALMAAPQPTAAWGYVRLRRASYDETELAGALSQVLAQPWRDAFVFIKHEAPDSPLVARRLAEIAGSVALR